MGGDHFFNGINVLSEIEKKNIGFIASLYAFRMLGLFMVLPVFMVAGQELDSATPFLLGLALGIYGLSQALFQIPFGAASDRFGRKKLLYLGLLLFGLGGLIAAFSESIYGVILGRFLQGAGAIASVLMALLGDLTKEENRTKAMASVGMTIGLAFAVSLVVGPWILSIWGLQGLFLFTSVTALLGVFIVSRLSSPVMQMKRREFSVVREDLGEVLKNPQLVRLNLGILFLHFVLTAVFVALPLQLVSRFDLPLESHGLNYLWLMGLGFVAMIPLIIWGEKKQRVKVVFQAAVFVLTVVFVALATLPESLAVLWFLIWLFFVAFNYLEATLPSLVSRMVPAGKRGTAMGLYSSAQFMGAFLGGALAGWMISVQGLVGVYGMCALFALLWAGVVIGMLPPPNTRSVIASLKPFGVSDSDRVLQSLRALKGVEDVTLVIEEQAAYLKVDKGLFDEDALKQHPLTHKA